MWGICLCSKHELALRGQQFIMVYGATVPQMTREQPHKHTQFKKSSSSCWIPCTVHDEILKFFETLLCHFKLGWTELFVPTICQPKEPSPTLACERLSLFGLLLLYPVMVLTCYTSFPVFCSSCPRPAHQPCSACLSPLPPSCSPHTSIVSPHETNQIKMFSPVAQCLMTQQ